MRPVFILLFSALLAGTHVYAQEAEEIELLHADVLEGDESLGKNVFRLTGNVRFRHNGAVMSCDSAFRYNLENRFHAFGNVHINRGDTVHAYGQELLYDGATGIAKLTKSVRMTDRHMELSTPRLDYHTASNMAYYKDGGVLVDGNNRLTSRKGYYYAGEQAMYFRDSVVLVNPSYRVEGDTLRYHTPTATAFFLGPTTIVSSGEDSTFIFCGYGWYDTRSGKSYFSDQAFMQSKNQRLSGDSLLYDKTSGIGRAFQNVEVFDVDNNILVNGEYAIYYDTAYYSLVTEKALFTRITGNDSLFLHADTLFASWDSSSAAKTYYAFHHVNIFKSDLQGKCDSLIYNTSDSIIIMHGKPVLWSDDNQLTSDSVHLRTTDEGIDRMLLFGSAFIASEVDSVRFNQVRGKHMTGYFSDDRLRRIDVSGNGQAIYYVSEGAGDSTRLTGVNRADCSDLSILVDSNRVKRIQLYTAPSGTLYPIGELDASALILKGFAWYGHLRPLRKEDIFVWK